MCRVLTSCRSASGVTCAARLWRARRWTDVCVEFRGSQTPCFLRARTRSKATEPLSNHRNLWSLFRLVHIHQSSFPESRFKCSTTVRWVVLWEVIPLECIPSWRCRGRWWRGCHLERRARRNARETWAGFQVDRWGWRQERNRTLSDQRRASMRHPHEMTSLIDPCNNSNTCSYFNRLDGLQQMLTTYDTTIYRSNKFLT